MKFPWDAKIYEVDFPAIIYIAFSIPVFWQVIFIYGFFKAKKATESVVFAFFALAVTFAVAFICLGIGNINPSTDPNSEINPILGALRIMTYQAIAFVILFVAKTFLK